MNKKLLMAAVASALVAAPMMSAHAAATVYGKLNVGVASVDSGNTTDSSTLAVTDNASRLGVKGDEDLGGGLKAIYMMEFTVDADAAATIGASGRDVYAGLQGGWGSVRLGAFNSVYKALSTGLEIFGDTTADFSTVGSGTIGGLNGETREANQISYSSPDMSGFQIGIGSSRGESGQSSTGATPEENPLMIAVTYNAGPLYLGIGMKDMDETQTTGLDDSMKFAGRFNMDAFSIWAVMETQSAKGTKAVGNSETDTTHIGASYKMANNTFALTYTKSDDSQDGYDVDALSLGVIHALSKNTAIKGLYTTIDNSTNATDSGSILSSVSGMTATVADKDPTALEVQLSVSF